MGSAFRYSGALIGALLGAVLTISPARGEPVIVPFALEIGDEIVLDVEIDNELEFALLPIKAPNEELFSASEQARYEERIDVIEANDTGYRINLAFHTNDPVGPIIVLIPGGFIVHQFRSDSTLTVDLDRWGAPVKIVGWRDALEDLKNKFAGDNARFYPNGDGLLAELDDLLKLDDEEAAHALLPVLSFWSEWHGAELDTAAPTSFELIRDPVFDSVAIDSAMIEDGYLLLETRSEANKTALLDAAEATTGRKISTDVRAEVIDALSASRTAILDIPLDGGGVEFLEETARIEASGAMPMIRTERLTIRRKVD